MEKNWSDFIKQEITDNKIVLFIRGTPQFPRCGFTARTIELFNHIDQPFITHDMDSDPGLWQALKDMNDWPTAPQIFINGEFVGGCDNALEMYNNGEMKTELEK